MNGLVVVGLFTGAFLILAIMVQFRRNARRDAVRSPGVPQGVTAYGYGADLGAEELGPVGASEAIAMLHERNRHGSSFFEDAEEAMIRTMVGFSRSDSDYIEFNATGGLISARVSSDLSRSGREETAELALPEAEALTRAYLLSSRALIDHWLTLPDIRTI